MHKFYGYARRILRIDLTESKITKETINIEEMKKYLGGIGLASKILFDEVLPEVEPFDPENRIIISAGPLVGALAPSACRFMVTTLQSVLRGESIAREHNHKLEGY